MTRTPIWKTIAETLTAEIAEGHYKPTEKLPTEAELSARFGVNRHTVRRALAEMQAQGLVHARRGAGVFVAADPTPYPIGKRVRFHQNLADAGRAGDKTPLIFETRFPDAPEAEALTLSPDDQVHVFEGIARADGTPITLFRSVFPAARFPRLLANLRANPSITAALRKEGVQDYTRAETRLTAKRANPTQALHLQLREGAPLLRAVGINVDDQGKPVEFGTTWFVGDRVQLIVGE